MVSHDLYCNERNSQVLCVNVHLCCAGTPETISNDPTFIHFLAINYQKILPFTLRVQP